MSNPLIEYLNFRPVKRDKSLIGFAGFKYNNELTFSDVAVHQILNSKKVRLLYPFKIKPSKSTQMLLDKEITGYINANYSETLK